MIDNLEADLVELLAEIQSYKAKPTKASSGRIRTKLGLLKKQVTEIRATLVKADKAGY